MTTVDWRAEFEEQGKHDWELYEKTELVYRSIRKRHLGFGWVFLTEVRTQTGGWNENYIDALAFALWHSLKYERVAYEVKISRSGWLKELKKPTKCKVAMDYSHRFWFALPIGIVEDRDLTLITDGCGVLEVHNDGEIKIRKRAERREASDMPITFIASLLRNAKGRDYWK